MLPRERVLRAIARLKTDRAPADYGAHPDVTERLIERLGVVDEEALLQALHVDMRRIPAPYNQPPTGPDAEGYMRDMWGRRWRETDPGDGQPNEISPFSEETTVDDVHEHPWPDPAALDYSGVREECLAYCDTYALYGSPWSPFFHEVGWLIGQERFYIWMTAKPDVVEAIIGHVVDYEIEATHRFLQAADGLIDITYFGNDFGTQRGLFISPRMYERFIRKPLKRYFDVSYDYGCRVMKHSCGAIRGILPAFIEDGVDILDPVQVNAAGMALSGLVRDFGDQLCFHGAVDTQTTLPFGTVQDVRDEVRSYLDLVRDRGGYILCGSQEFIEDIPLDNILAMYDENHREGYER